MKAFVVEKDYSWSVKDVSEPKLNPFTAKVKTLGCAVCGSDAKILHGTLKGTPSSMYPLVMGHEAVGEVVETGERVTSFKVGDKVLCPYNFGLDGYGSAWGAFAEYGTVFDIHAEGAEALGPVAGRLGQRQTIVPEYIDPLEATVMITLRETLGACRRFRMDANESVAVYGLGPVGISFIKFLSLRGLKPIIGVSNSQSKLDQGLAAGADFVVNASDPQKREKILDIAPKGLDHVLDAAGITDIYNEAMGILKEDGQIAAYGVPGDQSMTLDWSGNSHYNFILNFYQMSDVGLDYWASNQVNALVKSGDVVLSDYVEGYFPFSDICDVMDRFLRKEYKKKVVIKF
ncbi:MAG: alcohol dehydrogenase catalytic domain-containing protein [Clostridiales Family XIII bacterium]|jgi:threonine dehydrogenase-like Zn-dependent dehydrogenase|nr:alcohol dehydrogenase catalytic domain-containing protein [Clostridiales Family XIII bacterium]